MAEPIDYTMQTARRVVIVAYKPFPGKEDALLALTREHVPLLRSEGASDGLASDGLPRGRRNHRRGVRVGTGALARAHHNAAVARLWQRYAEVCEYLPLNQLPETAEMFAGFDPIAL